MVDQLESLFGEIRSCTHCSYDIPMGPRSVITGKISASIYIIGQAPGLCVHKSGIPSNDASGKRLREWLDVDDKNFYDERKIAILPIGFVTPEILLMVETCHQGVNVPQCGKGCARAGVQYTAYNFSRNLRTCLLSR